MKVGDENDMVYTSPKELLQVWWCGRRTGEQAYGMSVNSRKSAPTKARQDVVMPTNATSAVDISTSVEKALLCSFSLL